MKLKTSSKTQLVSDADIIEMLTDLHNAAEAFNKYYGLPVYPSSELLPFFLERVRELLKPFESVHKTNKQLSKINKQLSDLLEKEELGENLDCLLVGNVVEKLTQLIEYTKELQEKCASVKS